MRAATMVVAVAALAAAAPGLGTWSVNRSGSGAAAAKTLSSSAGNVPTASVAGNSVTLSWTASQFEGGGNVPGYVVKRYDGVTNILQSTTLSTCAAVVASTGCTENGVPPGTWKYTVTPAAADNWRGIESGQSSAVVVLV